MAKVRRYERRPGGGVPVGEFLEDATVVSALYRGIEEEDVPALARYADRAVGWIHPMVTRLPFDGTRRGLPVVPRVAFRRDEAGTGPRVSAETFLEFGDGVLVVGRFISAAGTEPFLHECFVRGGKVIRIREYPAGTVKRSEGDG